ncbi:MAG: recombination protein RmuC, partial [Pseudomonadota bacterium]|nr:recombination protein RmuC [Pseudomonadota bacterium]
QLRMLSESNDRRLSEVRTTVETRLQALQADNEKKLEQMRQTVDEKLHATLEARLGESFKQVAERLEQVHRGLGDMQRLASDVGSLNRVLNNVKTRGIFGEVQLAGLLEQVFTPEQYAVNVETVPGSGARVEFAIRLPGKGGVDDAPLWLPIDAKFPREDYERLLEAQDKADVPGVEAASKALELRLRQEARTIRDKYLAPPHTADFAILFVPTEGLYAEALRRPGLVEAMQRECRVMLAGPTTLLATLNSLQMGFRTLALEKRSSEVWQVLGAVKTEFGKFGDVLAKTRKKLDEASNTIASVETRTRVMGRALKQVEAMPDAQAQALLPGEIESEDESPQD